LLSYYFDTKDLKGSQTLSSIEVSIELLLCDFFVNRPKAIVANMSTDILSTS